MGKNDKSSVVIDSFLEIAFIFLNMGAYFGKENFSFPPPIVYYRRRKGFGGSPIVSYRLVSFSYRLASSPIVSYRLISSPTVSYRSLVASYRLLLSLGIF